MIVNYVANMEFPNQPSVKFRGQKRRSYVTQFFNWKHGCPTMQVSRQSYIGQKVTLSFEFICPYDHMGENNSKIRTFSGIISTTDLVDRCLHQRITGYILPGSSSRYISDPNNALQVCHSHRRKSSLHMELCGCTLILLHFSETVSMWSKKEDW